MDKTGFVLVSHSERLADGLVEILQEMNDGSVVLEAAGGTGDGHVGTNAVRIMEAVEKLGDCKDILIFADLGSSILSSEMALEMVDEEIAKKARLVDAPLVEGSFLAVVNAANASSAEELAASAEEARNWKKLES